jgi:Helix-turn-helix domain
MTTFTEDNNPGQSTPQPGEPFNPWRRACGFYPPDSVSRLRHVVILETRHRLTDGHKRLYTLLVRRWGQKGPCYPAQESLAADLGCCLRQVKVWIADLEAFGLIRYRRRGRGNGGRGLTNEYTFLWHLIFEVQAPLKFRFSKCEPGRFEVRKPAVLKCKGQHALYKEETRAKETHTERSSSSSQDPGRLRERAPAAEPEASANLWPKNPNAATMPFGGFPCGGWDTPEDFENWWRRLVQGHPNKNRNGVARTKALELVMAGTLDQSEFDEGYSSLRAAAGERWMEQNGRYAPNLWQFLDDLAWKCAPPPIPASSEYQSAEEYLRRVENE